MKIYIDETSIFKIDESKNISISGVGALVIPDCYQSRIEKKYGELRKKFKKHNGEVKGKLLTGEEVRKVIDILRRSDALFEMSAIDMNLEHEEGLEKHRKNQITGLGENIGPEHHENIHKAIADLQQQLKSMSLQLYVQSVVSTDVVNRVFNHAPTYYAQRQPKELGNFEWVIDAKSPIGPTTWEEWWKKVLMPFIQSKSHREPGFRLIGADYSHFKVKEISRPDWLPAREEKTDEKVIQFNEVFSDVKFISSINYGLEMVDILTNAVRRALVGNLNESGWEDISKLIIRKKDAHRIKFVSMVAGPERQKVPYYSVIKKLDNNGRSMLVSKTKQ